MKRYGVEHDRAKREVRRLVRSGLSKADASRIAKVKYQTVILWTSDMHTPRGSRRIAGFTLKILKELVSKGYMFPDDCKARSSYKTLSKYFPVKKVETHGMAVIVLEGNERKAMEALLERRDFRSISWQKLNQIRKAFGIKSMKRNNKIRERFFK